MLQLRCFFCKNKQKYN